METMTFKSATFGGFDRQDVLESFEQNNTKHQQEKSSLLQQIHKLKESHTEVATEYAKYRDGEKHKNELIAKLQLLVKKQSADNEKLKQLNSALEKHAKMIREQHEQLKNKQLEMEESTQKNASRMKMFEESGYSAERILSEANARSASTLADANNRASAILEEAASKASQNLEEANRRAAEMVRKAEEEAEQIKYSVQKYNQQTKKRLSDIATTISEREKRVAIKSGEIIRDARATAAEIVREAKGKLDQANDQYVKFDKELRNFKLSMQAILQQMESKVDSISQNMPKQLDTHWLSNSEIPEDDFAKDELFRAELFGSGDVPDFEMEDSDLDQRSDLDDFEKMLNLNGAEYAADLYGGADYPLEDQQNERSSNE